VSRIGSHVPRSRAVDLVVSRNLMSVSIEASHPSSMATMGLREVVGPPSSGFCTLVSPDIRRAGPVSHIGPKPTQQRPTVHGNERRSRRELLARVWSLLLLCCCPLSAVRLAAREGRCRRRTISPRGRSSTNSTSRVRSRLSFSCFLSSGGAVVLIWCFGCGGDVQGRKRPRRSRPRSCKPRNPR
jgi:hypothetical protein